MFELTIQEQLLGPDILKYKSLFGFSDGMLRANVTLVSSATNPAAVVDTALAIERTSDTFEKMLASFHHHR